MMSMRCALVAFLVCTAVASPPEGRHMIIAGSPFKWSNMSSTMDIVYGQIEAKDEFCNDDLITTGRTSNPFGNEIGVVCCEGNENGLGRDLECSSPGCLKNVGFAAAKARCESEGMFLPSVAQMYDVDAANRLFGGGTERCTPVDYGGLHVWTRDECDQPSDSNSPDYQDSTTTPVPTTAAPEPEPEPEPRLSSGCANVTVLEGGGISMCTEPPTATSAATSLTSVAAGVTEADIARAKAGGGQFLLDAAKGGRVKEVVAALAAGAEIEAQDGLKQTALHWAAGRGHLEATQALLAAGADTEAKDLGGSTPLHHASWNGHLTTVRALLEAGANHSAENNSGITPLYYATQLGHRAIADALRGAGATS